MLGSLVPSRNQRIAGLFHPEGQTMTKSVGDSFSTSWNKDGKRCATTVGVHCATPSVYEASLMTTVRLKTGRNAGWFAPRFQES